MSSSGSSTSGLTRGVRGWRVAHRGAPSPVGCADGIQCADGRRNRDVEWFVQGRQKRGAENPPGGRGQAADPALSRILARDQWAPLLRHRQVGRLGRRVAYLDASPVDRQRRKGGPTREAAQTWKYLGRSAQSELERRNSENHSCEHQSERRCR